MFLRKEFEDREVFINTDLIWKIEVSYSRPSKATGTEWAVLIAEGGEDPGTTRWYKVFIGNEIFIVRGLSGRLAEIAKEIVKNSQ